MGKNTTPFKQYIKLVSKIVVPFFLVWLVALGVFQFVFKGAPEDKQPLPPIQTDLNDQAGSDPKVNTDTEDTNTPVPVEEKEYITVALLGLDKSEYLTDVMMIGVYNITDNVVNTFSIPRDSYIQLNDATAEKIGAPKVLKLNEMHTYAKKSGVDNPEQYTLSALQEITGLEIDHYAKISLSVFNDMVDAIGGVDINVPILMDYYDPYQDLYIYIEPGQQTLDGKKAEGFVRYRATYANGDIDRIEMQHYFMKAFMNSALEPEIITQIPGIVSTLYSNVDTDVSLWDILSYTKYLDDLTNSNISTHTIPGEGMYINDISYFVFEADRVHNFVQDQLTEVVTKESVQANIEVLNGSNTNGLAGQFQTRLNDTGYNVTSIGTYEGARTNQTRIYVTDETLGKDLVSYFKSAEILPAHDNMPEGVNIQIILGRNE